MNVIGLVALALAGAVYVLISPSLGGALLFIVSAMWVAFDLLLLAGIGDPVAEPPPVEQQTSSQPIDPQRD